MLAHRLSHRARIVGVVHVYKGLFCPQTFSNQFLPSIGSSSSSIQVKSSQVNKAAPITLLECAYYVILLRSSKLGNKA